MFFSLRTWVKLWQDEWIIHVNKDKPVQEVSENIRQLEPGRFKLKMHDERIMNSGNCPDNWVRTFSSLSLSDRQRQKKILPIRRVHGNGGISSVVEKWAERQVYKISTGLWYSVETWINIGVQEVIGGLVTSTGEELQLTMSPVAQSRRGLCCLSLGSCRTTGGWREAMRWNGIVSRWLPQSKRSRVGVWLAPGGFQLTCWQNGKFHRLRIPLKQGKSRTVSFQHNVPWNCAQPLTRTHPQVDVPFWLETAGVKKTSCSLEAAKRRGQPCCIRFSPWEAEGADLGTAQGVRRDSGLVFMRVGGRKQSEGKLEELCHSGAIGGEKGESKVFTANPSLTWSPSKTSSAITTLPRIIG